MLIWRRATGNRLKTRFHKTRFVKRFAAEISAVAVGGRYGEKRRLCGRRAVLENEGESESTRSGKSPVLGATFGNQKTLIEFYVQMKKDEPFSSIPDIALNILK
jgi:hypothetical protein